MNRKFLKDKLKLTEAQKQYAEQLVWHGITATAVYLITSKMSEVMNLGTISKDGKGCGCEHVVVQRNQRTTKFIPND